MSGVRLGLVRSGLILSLALMAGRLAGFVRELMLASTLGLSAQADVAIVLLTLPDLLVNLLLSGGLSVALVPALRGRNREDSAALFAQASLSVAGLFGLLALAFVLAPGFWLSMLAPGLRLADLAAPAWVWACVALALPLSALSGVSSAALNAGDRFFVAGCGTLLFNICVISALGLGWRYSLSGDLPLLLLAMGIAGGAMLRWGSQMLALRSQLIGVWLAWRGRCLLDGALLRHFAAGLASASLLVLVPVLIRACASWLGNGQLAAFNYAIKLVELPLGILITSLATVAFPRLSAAYVEKDEASFQSLLGESLRRSFLMSLAVVLWGWQFGDTLVGMLLGHGRLGGDEQQHVLWLTQLALLSVPWVGLGSLLIAALNARQQAAVVLRCTLLVLLSLPMLCLPGVVLHSAGLLMAALPVLHFLLLVLLLRALGAPSLGGGVRAASKMLAPCLTLVAWWGLAVGLDIGLSAASLGWSGMYQVVVRAALAGVAFLAALVTAIRLLGRANEAS